MLQNMNLICRYSKFRFDICLLYHQHFLNYLKHIEKVFSYYPRYDPIERLDCINASKRALKIVTIDKQDRQKII